MSPEQAELMTRCNDVIMPTVLAGESHIKARIESEQQVQFDSVFCEDNKFRYCTNMLKLVGRVGPDLS